ncbi:MAG: phenylalanine--tRNA ligase subunit beta [Puniceicoccales bacterium]|jgi:phenylalanyl-tRNA synthetase beta chain|nr:phenylalanine--tRNA ligase subunit beta [Puniceicoccales bacterium]
MKISLQWLGNYVDLSSLTTAQIADALPMLGLEVESVSTTGLPPLENVVIGEILSFEKHPAADKLAVCRVNTGADTPLQIVCGAKNFKVGDRVPVALPGAALPGGIKIKASLLRGVESQGMMCSADEIGQGNDHAGLLILTQLNPPIGAPINELFPPPDTVFDISVTANRSDALSVIGVARDLAAYFDRSLHLPQIAENHPAPDASTPPQVTISSATCPYYTATYVRNVKVGTSPKWMCRDLEAAGLRPLNNIVDVTNWVMLETGQPLHAFDAAKIPNSTILVRNAQTDEKLTLLDGRVVTLQPSDCVIADTQKPLAIAGVMGGEDSGVSAQTVDIIVEAAWFTPAAVRATSRRLSAATDSAQRFIRDVDPNTTLAASRRAVELILQTAGGNAGNTFISGAPPRSVRTIETDGDYVRARLGHAVPDAAILDVFRRLGFSVETDAAGSWRVSVPSFRPDIERPIDLVEEFIRIHGTDAIPIAPIAAPSSPAADAPIAHFTRRATTLLAARGFNECWHYTLADGTVVERLHGAQTAATLSLANPLATDQSHVRASLLPGLLNALSLNLAGNTRPDRFFEIGRVFRPDRSGALRELVSAAFVSLVEPENPSWKKVAPPDFFSAKKLALDIAALAGVSSRRLVFTPENAPLWQSRHAGRATDRAGRVEIACGIIDAIFARDQGIKTTVIAGEVLFSRDTFAAAPSRPRFREWSPFPPVTKDVALIVDAAMPAGDALEAVRNAATTATGKAFIVENITCFDVYSGTGLPPDRKSLAFSITFRAPDKTLTDDDANKAFGQALALLEKNPAFKVRKN